MNILAIGAHFDDIEMGCGGTLARHIRQGDKVYMYVATTSGFAGSKGSRTSEDARREGIEAAKIIGADLLCGEFETFHLEFNDLLNAELVQIINDYSIDTIYTHWFYDSHHDHAALAHATLHSARHVPRILMYQSNWYASAEFIKKNFFVDISLDWGTKEKAILAYKSEMERTGSKWIKYFKNEAVNNGLRVNTDMAEAFEAVLWLY